MNEPTTPTPHLENTPQSDMPQTSTAQISQSVNPASSQQPVQQATQTQEPAAQPQPQEVTQPTTPIEPTKAGGKTILIVEDERFISELYTRALEKAGYSVSTAGDGEQALQIATTRDFDLILLDIMLPTMNGVDLLYKMKDPGSGKPVSAKVIITTNMDQKEETKDKVEQMADGYLIKAEVTPKELVAYVNQVFGN